MKNGIIQKILNTTFYFNAIFLIISIVAGFFSPTVFPLFSFIALFFPLIWIFNVLFLLAFLFQKSRLAIISLVILLLSFYQVLLIYNLSDNEYTKNNAHNTKLVSFNTGNADTINPFKRRKEVFNNLIFQNSNIICLQEFTPNDELGIDILESLQNKINVDFYGIEMSDSSGLSIYTNYEIVEYGWLKQDKEDTYALWALLNINNDTITLINVQLQSIRLEEEELESMTEVSQIIKLPGNISSIYSKLKRGFEWREEQVEKLSDLIGNSKYPVVLCGDFNDPPSSYTYRELSKLLNDAFLEKGNGFGFTYAGSLPFLRIDYFMISSDLNVTSYEIIKETYSDHYPVKVKVEVKRASQHD